MNTMLWISGWSADASIWKALQLNFPDYQHQTIDFTQCSSRQEIIDVTTKTFQRLNSPTTIVAWSMGAMLTLEYGIFGKRWIQQLLLISATHQFIRSPHYPAGWDQRILKRMLKQLTQHKKEVIHQFDQRMFTPEEQSTPAYTQWGNRRQVLPSTAALCAGLEYLQDYQLTHQHLTLWKDTPIHLLTGQEDTICPKEGAQQLHQQLPTSSLTLWKNAGHLPFRTEPERFYHWMKGKMK